MKGRDPLKIEIKALIPEYEEAYFDFFDHRAFSDGSPNYPCYCNAFNMSVDEIVKIRERSNHFGEDADGWKNALRESAVDMVRTGRIQGYLAFEDDMAIGWCNANDRMNYNRVGEFNLENVPSDQAPSDCQRRGQVKSVVCFEIAPGYRGKGISTQLLNRVCADAQREGYDFVEAYPSEREQESSQAYTGPIRLYEKAGFKVFSRIGSTIIMRKPLKR